MFYISRVFDIGYQITDSSTGESFSIDEEDIECFPMGVIVGYLIGGIACEVPFKLIELLDYIESISITVACSDSYVEFLKDPIIRSGSYNLVVYAGSKIYNVLDIILGLSRCGDVFEEMLRAGVLVAKFGITRYVKIYLCGDFYKYIVKLVTLCSK